MSDSAQSDLELLARIRDGDHDALFTLHQRYVAVVYRSAIRILTQRFEAEEATQDVFLLLWNRRKTVRIHGESVLPWLLVSVKYESLNRARKLQREHRRVGALREDVPGGEDPLELILQTDAVRGLREAIGQLSTTDRTIVLLCLERNLTYKEAAARLGLTHASVRNRLARARGVLQQALGPQVKGGNHERAE